MRQVIQFDRRANKEIELWPKNIQVKLRSLINILSESGKLSLPDGKKINDEIFEIRIKSGNQYRCLYAYCNKKIIVILSAFIKKQQKTPAQEIKKALNRLKVYEAQL